MHFFILLLVSVCFQLRVVRAFRSTLEDLEERRSVHSLRSSRSHTGAMGNALHPLLMAKSPTTLLPPHYTDISFIDEDPNPTSRNTDLTKPTQETRI